MYIDTCKFIAGNLTARGCGGIFEGFGFGVSLTILNRTEISAVVGNDLVFFFRF